MNHRLPDVRKQACAILSHLAEAESGYSSFHLIRAARTAVRGTLTPAQWMNILHALVHRDFLSVDPDRGELVLTDRGRRFLEDGGEFSVDIDQPPPVLPAEVLPRFDETLYNRLRWKRRVLAEQEGVPPYRIFTNRALAQMAAYRPESLEDLKSLNGIGDRLAARYGQSFLTAIHYYLRGVA